MDDLVKQAIGLAEQRSKPASSVPWRFDEPWKQPWHIYSSSKQQWTPGESNTPRPHHQAKLFKRLALYSWNIDFMLPLPDTRMRAALRHLESLATSDQQAGTAPVIFLQECLASDLALLAADPWIQRTFILPDLDTSHWQSGHYGTTTLVSRDLPVADVFRVHYAQTRMQRDGLFVDVGISNTDGGVLRLCNTHLESLALDPPLRPAQMALCARYMRTPGVGFAAAAGDFNAVQDFDRHLHSDNGLQDAYLERGGNEDDAQAGHTWGQQAATTQRERFGTSRMDKVFFCGGAMRCVGFERIGASVEVEAQEEREAIVALGFERPWITDHLGVKATFELV